MSEEKIRYIIWKLGEYVHALEENKSRVKGDSEKTARYDSQIRVLTDVNRDIAFALNQSDEGLKTLRESMELYLSKRKKGGDYNLPSMNKTQEEIIKWCEKDGDHIFLSSAHFTEKLTVTYDTVMRNLKLLVDKGVLEVRRYGIYLPEKRRKSAWVNWYRIKEEEITPQQTLTIER